MKKQQDEITAIMKMREAASSGTQVGTFPGHPLRGGDIAPLTAQHLLQVPPAGVSTARVRGHWDTC